MNNQNLVELRSIEIYQQELDAIEKKYSIKSKSIDVIKNKYIEKLQLHRQWLTDLSQASDEIDDRINEMKKMIEVSKKNLEKFRKDLDQLRNDLANIRDQMDNDDSGIDGMLAFADEEEQDDDDDNPILMDIGNRSTALGEAIDKATTDLNQMSVKITELERDKNTIFSRYTELQEKYDQFTGEIELELYSSTDDRF